MKTSELTGPALDWAVMKCEGLFYRNDEKYGPMYFRQMVKGSTAWDSLPLPYSTDWEQGGPIIEREHIAVRSYGDFPATRWQADKWAFRFVDPTAYGPTPLVAAMRCFVASKLGDEVDVPEELL